MKKQYSAKASLDKADGYYKSGETAVCTVNFFQAGKPYIGKASCIVKIEDQVIQTVVLNCEGSPLTVKAACPRPGWLYFGFQILDNKGNVVKGEQVWKHRMKPDIVEDIGAIFDADKITPIAARPADFDEYWQNCRKELDKVPYNLRRVELSVPAHCRGKVKFYAVTLDIIEGNTATGYLAVPANTGEKSCPAYLSFLSWSWCDAPQEAALSAAEKGSIGFSVTWHGHPLGKPLAYYKAEEKKFNCMQGIENRDRWIMRNIYFRVMRELDYVKSLPEWDGRNLVVRGGSLGGAQAIVAAALDPAVSLAIVSVPSFCEFDTKGRRKLGTPLHYYKNRIVPDWLRCTAYYATSNFTPRIRCETHFCTGFVDNVCPPSTVFAAYNSLPEKTVKSMSTNPGTGHFGTTPNVKGNRRLEEYFKSVAVQQYGPDGQMK